MKVSNSYLKNHEALGKLFSKSFHSIQKHQFYENNWLSPMSTNIIFILFFVQHAWLTLKAFIFIQHCVCSCAVLIGLTFVTLIY